MMTATLMWMLGCGSAEVDGHLPAPIRESTAQLETAGSLFGVAHGAGRLVVFRYTPGTMVLDDATGDFRVVIRGDEVWYATRGSAARRVPEWEPWAGLLSDLGSWAGGGSLRDVTPERFGVGEGRAWDPARDGGVAEMSVFGTPVRLGAGPDGQLSRVEILRSDGSGRPIDVDLPGIRPPVDPDGSWPTLPARFRVDYLRTDVPLEDGWSDLRPPDLPPLPSGTWRSPRESEQVRRAYHLGDNPVPEHETTTELRLRASGEQDRVSHNLVSLEAQKATHDLSMTLRPSPSGKPWRDARAAQAQGCPMTLTARTIVQTRLQEGTRSCVEDARLVVWDGDRRLASQVASDPCTEWLPGQPRPSGGPGSSADVQHVAAELSVPVPGRLDLRDLRVDWTGAVTLQSLDSGAAYVETHNVGDVMLRWDCP